MLLNTLFPIIPLTTIEILIFVVALLGAAMLPYAIFVEKERRQDLITLIGSGCLLVYALYHTLIIFSIAMGGLFLAALIEFWQIYFGLHKHNKEDLKKYKMMK